MARPVGQGKISPHASQRPAEPRLWSSPRSIRLLPARQLERVHGLLHVLDGHGDGIGAHALMVVRASALFGPALQVLEAVQPVLELLAQHAGAQARRGLAGWIEHQPPVMFRVTSATVPRTTDTRLASRADGAGRPSRGREP